MTDIRVLEAIEDVSVLNLFLIYISSILPLVFMEITADNIFLPLKSGISGKG